MKLKFNTTPIISSIHSYIVSRKKCLVFFIYIIVKRHIFVKFNKCLLMNIFVLIFIAFFGVLTLCTPISSVTWKFFGVLGVNFKICTIALIPCAYLNFYNASTHKSMKPNFFVIKFYYNTYYVNPKIIFYKLFGIISDRFAFKTKRIDHSLSVKNSCQRYKNITILEKRTKQLILWAEFQRCLKAEYDKTSKIP